MVKWTCRGMQNDGEGAKCEVEGSDDNGLSDSFGEPTHS